MPPLKPKVRVAKLSLYVKSNNYSIFIRNYCWQWLRILFWFANMTWYPGAYPFPARQYTAAWFICLPFSLKAANCWLVCVCCLASRRWRKVKTTFGQNFLFSYGRREKHDFALFFKVESTERQLRFHKCNLENFSLAFNSPEQIHLSNKMIILFYIQDSRKV